MPQKPQVTEKAEDEGGKGTQSISSIRQTPEVTGKTEDEGGNPGSSQPPEKENDQVWITIYEFPLGRFHRLPDGSDNIESELALDRQCNFEELVKNMKDDTPKIRKWYVEVDRRLNESNTDIVWIMARCSDEDLGRMMARSGLLLLEYLRFLADLRRLRRSSNEFLESMDWQLSEAVIKIGNRIPIFVLKKILEWERDADKDENRLDADGDADKDENRGCRWGFMQIKMKTGEGDADTDLDSILKHAWPELSPIKYDSHVIAGVPLKDDSHLLEFVYENIISASDFKDPYKRKKNNRRVSRITLPRAVQLKGKGVKFAPIKGPLNEIRFDRRNLTLYLPTIEMDGKADAVLRNLVYFEDSKQGKESQPLRSYVNLMQRLIDTADDVEALRDGGIIHSHLGTNNDVAKLWNEMNEQLQTNNIKYEPIDNAIYGVKSFYTSKYRAIYTEIYERYFSKPWSVISLFAACILLGLAAFQTYLAWEQVRLQRESMPKT